MSYRTYQKRTAALASLAALAGTAVLTAAPLAHAEVVDVEYNCKTPIGPWGVGRPWGVTLFWLMLWAVVPAALFRVGM